MKWHKPENRLPKLLGIDEKKRRYQLMSKRCLVLYRWNNVKNPLGPPEYRFATYFKHGFVIEGVTGGTTVVAWTYLPTAKELMEELENAK